MIDGGQRHAQKIGLVHVSRPDDGDIARYADGITDCRMLRDDFGTVRVKPVFLALIVPAALLVCAGRLSSHGRCPE